MVLAPIASTIFASPARAATIRPIAFPVIGSTNFSDDFGAPRVGHRHQGNDVFGVKRQSLIAAVDGIIEWVVVPDDTGSLGLSIRDDDGYEYWYLHLNNDTPGTDDGASRGIFAYAPDVRGGRPVVRGQLLGWLGDSGNAETTPPHLHFELHEPDGDAINPYATLRAAQHVTRPTTPPPLADEILPFGQFTGGASIAIGNVDGNNPEEELVVGSGAGGGPLVRVYHPTNGLTAQFFAFEKTFRGGLDVATGDVDGDGTDEIIVAAGPGGQPEVRVFSVHGLQRLSITAYTGSFRGGVRVAAADLDGDGRAEIITTPGRGGGPHVKVFDGQGGNRLAQFFAYGERFRGGVSVAAYAAQPGSAGLIVTAAGAGGGPHVKVFDGLGLNRITQFFAGDTSFRGGLRLDVANLDPSTTDPEIAVVPLTNGKPQAQIYSLTGEELATDRFYEPWWEGGYDIAVSESSVVVVNGIPGEARRRTSIRSFINDVF